MRFKIATIVIASLAMSGATHAQSAKRAPAESSLVGVRLFESGVSIVRRFGSPEVIEPIVIGGQAGPAGGGGGGGGAGSGQLSLSPGTPGAGGGGGGGGGAVNTPNVDMTLPGDELLGNPFDLPRLARQGGMPPKGGGDEGQTNMGSAGGPAIAGAAPGGAPPSGGVSGGSQNVTFTRWLYRRGSSRYGFVIDRFNRVVQIEAVGLSDNRVRTRRGVGFGSTFAQLMINYGTPDGYEISGDSILVRYLNTSRVAFRLSRLAPNRPHQVTGIVVSAGKP